MVPFLYEGMKADFVSNKLIRFEYLLKVNGDTLNEQELMAIESEFAQIQSSEDYIELIGKLEKLALKNNKRINKF